MTILSHKDLQTIATRCADREVRLVPPGHQCHATSGRQGFGSGGYGASWRSFGNCQKVNNEAFDTGFTHGENTVLEMQPDSAVTQSESDCIGNGRDWSFVTLCLSDETKDELCAELFRRWKDTHPDERRSTWWRARSTLKLFDALCVEVEQHNAQERQRIARLEAKWRQERYQRELERAMNEARKYAGDEATARSIVGEFMPVDERW